MPLDVSWNYFPAIIYLLKVNNKNTRKRCDICSKLTRKARRSGVFIVNFEHISHIFLVFLMLAGFDVFTSNLVEMYPGPTLLSKMESLQQ